VQQQTHPVNWRDEQLNIAGFDSSVLPYGLGRSYGDVCLNDGGRLLCTRRMNRFMSFDSETGLLCCESGVSLAEILEFCVPRGWFLAVTPGTKHVTVGGAIANDVHGKNHHVAGTFGSHVTRFELLRSDGERMVCSPESKPLFFSATIGGMGLTGLITWAEIQLIPIKNPFFSVHTTKFGHLDEFFELSERFEQSHSYTVSWVDCLARGKHLGRGLFMAGNHAGEEAAGRKVPNRSGGIPVPVDFPEFALNGLTVRAFNTLYYNRQFRRESDTTVHYNPFFYPLDALQGWNRIYGKRGFLQYQCVVPHDDAAPIRGILERIARSGQGSFLAVLKVMGKVKSPGQMSFPKPGVTLALDFPIRGESTFQLFRELDDVVRGAGGRLYSAKDACMSAADYQAYYPQWENFSRFIDPAFSSSFWRRVMGTVEGVPS